MIGWKFIYFLCHTLASKVRFKYYNKKNERKKFLSYLSYVQLDFKEFETNKSIGFNYEKQIFIIVSSSERNLKNTTIFTKFGKV